MTRFIILSLLAALLGGCVVVPAGQVSYSDGYYRRGYYYDGPRYYSYDYGPRYYSYGYGYRGYYRDHAQ